jgi:hypothetical protein
VKPDVVLAPGQGYVVDDGGLVDLAGNAADVAAPLRLPAFAEAPLVPSDGFESATGASVGGAPLVRSGPLPPLAGAASVYVGGAGAPALGAVAPGATFMVRLARRPRDSELFFSFRQVEKDAAPFSFFGRIQVGSVGRSVGTAPSAGPPPTVSPAGGAEISPPGVTLGDVDGPFPEPTSVTTAMWGDAAVKVSAAATLDVTLPRDVTDEVLVSITALGVGCGPTALGSGLLVDDLRLR